MPQIVSKIVEIFIYRKFGNEFKFLLLKRNKNEIYPGIWSIAGGEIDKGEKAYEAATREMKEETGLTPKHIYLIDNVNVFYEMHDDVVHLVPVFLAETEEDEVKLSDEHSEYAWINYEDAYKKIYWNGWKNNLKLIHEILNNENLLRTLKEIKL